ARDFNPTYGSTEWNHVYNNMSGVYMALLSKDTPSPFLEKDDAVAAKKEVSVTVTDAKAGNKTNKAVDKGVDKSVDKSANAVKFDAEGIADRIIRIPVPGANYDNIYSDGKKVYYYGRGATQVYDLEKQKED